MDIETEPLYEAAVGTNTDQETVDMDTQTDVTNDVAVHDDMPLNEEALAMFLESVYPRVANALEQPVSNKVFENYEVKISDMFDTSKLLHTLTTNFQMTMLNDDEEEEYQTNDDFSDQFDDYNLTPAGRSTTDARSTTVDEEEQKGGQIDVTSVSWSCNGNTMAVGYGKQGSNSVGLQGCVSIWGVFRRDMEPNKPSKNIEVSSSITSLKFHPSDPSLLAGGNFIGEIYLWSVFNDEPEICCSRADEYYHRESVTQLILIL